jgi:glutaredoxin/glutathione-dependent peroxiredoxin
MFLSLKSSLFYLLAIAFYLKQYFSFKFSSSATKFTRTSLSSLRMASVGTPIPSGILVDVVEPSPSEVGTCVVAPDPVDIGAMLKSVKKAVIFAVPGAFTSTCSNQHLPSFINNESALRTKGVNEIYCLSVNDKSVMRAWGQSTPGFPTSQIKMLADGSAELTVALGLQKDLTKSRMGVRSMRYAVIVENGVITSLNVDEKGMTLSSAENILSILK